MAASMSREDYLKRYLSVNSEEKKKKKRKKAHATVKASRVKIFDDDIDLKSLQPDNLSNTFDDDVGDNEPTVVDVIDERPEHIKLLEKYRASGAWKTFENTEEAKSNQRHDSDSDHSSQRRSRHDSDSDQSPVRRQRHDSDSDQSPIKRQRHDSDSDESPVKRQKHDSDSDESPPRKQHSKQSDNLHKRSKAKRHDSDSDQSPQRKKSKSSSRPQHNIQSDQSPPRRRGHKSVRSGQNSDSDQSPPRGKQNDSDSDQSPPRRRGNKSDSDQSPPRRQGNRSDSDQSPPRRHKSSSKDSARDSSRGVKGTKTKEEMTLGGKKAGLSSAKDMRREAEELRRKEDESFGKISADRLGKGSATVFRDKSGRKRDFAEERKKESEEAKKKEKEDEQFKQWGKGLKQVEEQSQRLETDMYETSKPLARYRDDEDLDKMLRDMDRSEDPMLAFIKKKKSKNPGPPVNEKPRYKGPAPPPNRFGIMPGYRWDGVDRSNGLEKKMFAKMAEKKATATQAYKWSTEDM